MKKDNKSQVKKFSILAIAGLGVLIPATFVGCGGNSSASNELKFDNGIVITYGDSMKNLTNYSVDKSATFLVSGEGVFGSNLQPGTSYEITNPTLKPKNGTKNYFLRAKLAYYGISANSGSVDISSDVDSIFTVKPDFSSSWLESDDGYFYNVKTGVNSWNEGDNLVKLKVNHSNGDDVMLFGTNSRSFAVSNDARINYDIIAVNVVVEAVNSDNQTEAGLASLGWTMADTLVTGLTLNFNADGGSQVSQVANKTEGETVYVDVNNLNYMTNKPGYVFDGWMLGNEVVQSVTFGKEDITLKAKWTPIQYAVKFVNETEQNLDPNTYTIGQTISLGTAEKDGYTFNGWSFGGQTYPAGNFVLDQNKILLADYSNTLTFTAEFTPIDYSLTYNLNGGTGSISDINKYHIGEFATISSTIPTKTGYDFKGWSDGQNLYESGVVCFGAEDITLTAQWNLSEYSLYYNLDDGSYSGSVNLYPTEKFTIQDTNVSLISFAENDKPTKLGYTFAGWTLTKGSQECIDVVNFSERLDDVIVYAIWTAVPYELNYNLDGGAVLSEDEEKIATTQNHTIGEKVAVANVTPTKKGYTFAGWIINGDDLRVVDSEGEIIFGAGNITLTAKWEAINYTLTYVVWSDEENSFVEKESDSTYTVEDSNISIGNGAVFIKSETEDYETFYLLREGYTFDYWTLDAEDGDVSSSIVEGLFVCKISFADAKDHKLFAHYKKDLKVTYNLNDGITEPDELSRIYHVGDVISLTSTPLRVGYTFAGWKIGNTTYSEYDYQNGNYGTYTITSEENVEIVAQWTINTLSLTVNWRYNKYSEREEGQKHLDVLSTFNVNSGEVVLSEVALLTNPTRVGYTFKEFAVWDDLTGYTAIESVDFSDGCDKTIYVRWDEIPYTLTANYNGGMDAYDRESYQPEQTFTVESGMYAFGNLFTPSKAGYNFVGWALSQDATSEDVIEAIVFSDSTNADTYAKDVVIYAVWTPKNYNLNYSLNSGEYHGAASISGGTYTVESGNNGVVDLMTFESEDEPTRPGYAFGGWQINNVVVSTYDFKVLADNEYEPDSVTIYAKWVPIDYKLYLNFGEVEGVSYNGEPVEELTQLIGSTYHVNQEISLNNITRDGYIFDGWYINNDDQQKVIGDRFYFGTSDTTIYARWVQRITMNFYANEDVEVAYVSARIGTTCNAPSSISQSYITNKSLLGWKVKNGPDDIVFYPGDEINLTVELNNTYYEAVYIDAKFSAGSDAVELYVTHPVIIDEGMMTLPKCLYTSTTKHFVGWKYDETLYNPGDQIEFIEEMEFVAQWDFCLNVDANGGKVLVLLNDDYVDASKENIFLTENYLTNSIYLSFQLESPEGMRFAGIEATSNGENLAIEIYFNNKYMLIKRANNEDFERDVNIKILWDSVENCKMTFTFKDAQGEIDSEQKLILTGASDIVEISNGVSETVTYDCEFNEDELFISRAKLFDGYTLSLLKNYENMNPTFAVYTKNGQKLASGINLETLQNSYVNVVAGEVEIVLSWEEKHALTIVPGEGEGDEIVTTYSEHYIPSLDFLPFTKQGCTIVGFNFAGKTETSGDNNVVYNHLSPLFIGDVTATPVWANITFNPGENATANGTPVLTISDGVLYIPSDGEKLGFTNLSNPDYVIAGFETTFNGKTKRYDALSSNYMFTDGMFVVSATEKIYCDRETGVYQYFVNDSYVGDFDVEKVNIIMHDSYIDGLKLQYLDKVYVLITDNELFTGTITYNPDVYYFENDLQSSDEVVVIDSDHCDAIVFTFENGDKIYMIGEDYYFVANEGDFESRIYLSAEFVDNDEDSYTILKNGEIPVAYELGGSLYEKIVRNTYNCELDGEDHFLTKSFDGLQINTLWDKIPQVPVDGDVIEDDQFDVVLENLSKAYENAFIQTINNDITKVSYTINGNDATLTEIAVYMQQGLIMSPTFMKMYAEQEGASVNAKVIETDGASTYYLWGEVSGYLNIFILKLNSYGQLVEYRVERYDGLIGKISIGISGAILDSDFNTYISAESEEIEGLITKFNNSMIAAYSGNNLYLTTLDASIMSDDAPEGFIMTMPFEDGDLLASEIIFDEMMENLYDIEITYQETSIDSVVYSEYHFTAKLDLGEGDPIEITRIYKFVDDSLDKYYTAYSLLNLGEFTVKVVNLG